jgi:hypothetical protein
MNEATISIQLRILVIFEMIFLRLQTFHILQFSGSIQAFSLLVEDSLKIISKV